MTPRQVFDLAAGAYWLGCYPTPEERIAAAVEGLTAALGPPGKLWTLEASPHAATVAVLMYRGRCIGFIGSTGVGTVADRFPVTTAGRV